MRNFAGGVVARPVRLSPLLYRGAPSATTKQKILMRPTYWSQRFHTGPRFSALRTRDAAIVLLVLMAFAIALIAGAATTRPGLSLLPLGLLLVAGGLEVVRKPFNGLLIWFAVAPLIGIRGVSPAFNLAYDGIYRLLTLGLVLLVILNVLAERRSLKIGLPEVLLALYAIYTAGSVAFFSSNLRGDSLTALDRVLLPLAMYFLAKHLVDRPERLTSILSVLLFVALLQSAVAIAGSIPSLSGFLPRIWFTRSDRFTGSLGNPVAFGTTLLVTLVLLNHFQRYTSDARTRSLIKLVSVVGAVTIALTFSRSVWIGAALVLLLSVTLHRNTVKSIIPLALLTVGLLFSGFLAQDAAYARQRFSDSETIYGRIGRIQASFHMFEVHPIFGWGYRQMDTHFVEYLRQIPYFVQINYVGGVSHFTLLTILVEFGVVGLALYVVPIFLILKRSVRAARMMPRQGFWSRELVAVIWISIVVFLWTSSTMDMKYFPFALSLFWFLLGALASLTELAERGAIDSEGVYELIWHGELETRGPHA